MFIVFLLKYLEFVADDVKLTSSSTPNLPPAVFSMVPGMFTSLICRRPVTLDKVFIRCAARSSWFCSDPGYYTLQSSLKT